MPQLNYEDLAKFSEMVSTTKQSIELVKLGVNEESFFKWDKYPSYTIEELKTILPETVTDKSNDLGMEYYLTIELLNGLWEASYQYQDGGGLLYAENEILTHCLSDLLIKVINYKKQNA